MQQTVMSRLYCYSWHTWVCKQLAELFDIDESGIMYHAKRSSRILSTDQIDVLSHS